MDERDEERDRQADVITAVLYKAESQAGRQAVREREVGSCVSCWCM